MRTFLHKLLLLSVCCGLPVSTLLAEETGAELYAEYCAGCHGDNKSGLQEYDADLASFTERMEGVTENMPDFAGFFEADEVAALHEYLISPTE